MEKEYIYGKMGVNIKGNILMIKSKDMENIHGQMVKFIKDNGCKENSMVMVK